jgi:arylsulfatase A-like enzyme
VGNVFIDRERGRFSYSDDASWVEAEPIWSAAERQGVRSAVFFWVSSGTDWNGVGPSYRRHPFDSEIPETEKVDQILAWLDLPEAERPHLIMSWWHGVDHVAHRRGPDAGAVARQLEAQDAQLLRLLEGVDTRGLWERTTLVVVSDHGMARVSKRLDVTGPLRDAGIEAKLVPAGGAGYLLLEHADQLHPALEVLNQIDALQAWPSAHAPQELRAFHPERSGDIILLTQPPHFLYPQENGRFVSSVRRFFGGGTGAHGYRPDHPDMGAILYATGRGVPAGLELGAMRSVDIAPTIARLLGIEPPHQSEGEPLPGVGSPADTPLAR